MNLLDKQKVRREKKDDIFLLTLSRKIDFIEETVKSILISSPKTPSSNDATDYFSEVSSLDEEVLDSTLLRRPPSERLQPHSPNTRSSDRDAHSGDISGEENRISNLKVHKELHLQKSRIIESLERQLAKMNQKHLQQAQFIADKLYILQRSKTPSVHSSNGVADFQKDKRSSRSSIHQEKPLKNEIEASINENLTLSSDEQQLLEDNSAGVKLFEEKCAQLRSEIISKLELLDQFILDPELTDSPDLKLFGRSSSSRQKPDLFSFHHQILEFGMKMRSRSGIWLIDKSLPCFCADVTMTGNPRSLGDLILNVGILIFQCPDLGQSLKIEKTRVSITVSAVSQNGRHEEIEVGKGELEIDGDNNSWRGVTKYRSRPFERRDRIGPYVNSSRWPIQPLFSLSDLKDQGYICSCGHILLKFDICVLEKTTSL